MKTHLQVLIIIILSISTQLFGQEDCFITLTKNEIEDLPVMDIEVIDGKIYTSTGYGGFI